MTTKFEKVLQLINKSRLLILIPFIVLSCTNAQEGRELKKKANNFPSSYSNPNVETVVELSSEQQAAFDALNSIQVQGQHLYSTFSGISHDCLPPDSSFVLPQAELLTAMKELLARYYPTIPLEEQTKLATQAVLAQEEYIVLQCNDNSFGPVDHAHKKLLFSGTWILPEVLNRRDIIIKW